jgi:NTE family protein
VKTGDLKRFPLLVEFDEEDRCGLSELLEARNLAEGEMLFREGDEADALFLLLRGQIRISSAISGALGTLSNGSCLGAVSLMTIGRREASARAESDSDLLVLSRGDFRRLASDAPRTACRLAEAIVAQLASELRPQLARVQRVFSADGNNVDA